MGGSLVAGPEALAYSPPAATFALLICGIMVTREMPRRRFRHFERRAEGTTEEQELK
jgi:hypothetical protein